MIQPAFLLRAAALCAAIAGWATAPAHAADPACLDPGGIGGTGAPAAAHADSGIGGTGAALGRAPGGLGGTGAPAHGGAGGTGIVGTITGFASICVNGVEVHFEADVPVTENGRAARPERLAVGQVVAVEAAPSPRGLEARHIAILHALEGPLSALPSATAPLRVMGQPVRLAPDARLAQALRPGEAVSVSGLRNAQGEIVATRIDRAPESAEASAIGAIEAGGDLQGLALSGRRPPAGGEVLVRGRWNGTALEVRRTEPDPSIPFAGRVRHAVVEGLVHAREAGRVTLGGFSVTLEAGTQFSGGGPDELESGRRLRVSGEFRGDREVRASRIELMRVEREARPEDGRGRHRMRDDDDKRIRSERESDDRPGEDKIRERSEIRDARERLERIDKDERPERIDKRERLERIERLEKIERPERD